MEQVKTDIRQAVLEQLEHDARVNAQGLQVVVVDGQVTLSGVVPSYRAKWAAAEAARRVRGVYDVSNQIEVRPTTPSSDERIAGDIRSALMRDADLDAAGIHVDVHGGHVVLQGSVTDGWAKSRAEEDARWTRGVVSVDNELTVTPSGSAQDRDLALEVERALRRDAAVQPGHVDVTVEDRHVTLSGVVDSWAERNAALDDALHIRGVADVRDELALRYRER